MKKTKSENEKTAEKHSAEKSQKELPDNSEKLPGQSQDLFAVANKRA